MAPATRTSHTGRRAELEHLPHDGGAVDGGLGVGHGHDRGVAAEGGGPGARSRPSPPPPGPAGAGGRGGRPGPGPTTQPPASSTRAPAGASRPSPTAATTAVRRRARRPGGPRWRRRPCRPGSATRSRGTGAAPDPSRRNRTAMRTATPLATWRVMTERGRSATSAAISTPRFMGPGCMTRASSASSAGPVAGEAVAGGVLPQRRAAGPRSGARAACAAGRRRRPWAAPRRGRGSPSTGQPVEAGRQQGGRRHQGDLGAERGEGEHVGAGHPASA